ncbi:hypothetical protein ACFUT3_27100 [Streptomyces cinereoruber]|uniref:hypothetical protein n=1 Tax=Streptomyces cinereoruber TaxID=67260 RepID=UPI00362D060F
MRHRPADDGALPALPWQGALVGALLVLFIRPAAGFASLLGSRADARERLVTAVFGIRSIGSLFHLACALGHSDRASTRRRSGCGPPSPSPSCRPRCCTASPPTSPPATRTGTGS